MATVIAVPRSKGLSRRSGWVLVALALAVTAALAVAMLSRWNERPAVPDPISRIYSGQQVTGTGPGLSAVNSYAPEAGVVTGTGPGLAEVAGSSSYIPVAGPVTGTGPGLARAGTSSAPAGSPAQIHAHNLAR